METIDYILPAWTIVPLFNGDMTGLTEAEDKELEAFLEREGIGAPLDCEPYGFCTRNDMDKLSGDCYRVIFPA